MPPANSDAPDNERLAAAETLIGTLQTAVQGIEKALRELPEKLRVIVSEKFATHEKYEMLLSKTQSDKIDKAEKAMEAFHEEMECLKRWRAKMIGVFSAIAVASGVVVDFVRGWLF